MSRMLKSSGAMGLATVTSRVLGLVREQVYAGFMGTSAVAGAFTMANVVPNLFRRLLGEGALIAAFIPIFKAKEKNEGEVEMWRAANAVISGLVVATAAVSGLAILGLTVVLSQVPMAETTRLMLQLLRIMFPYVLLVCLAAVFMGMLNARGYFLIPALGATMLNVVMITCVVFVAPRVGDEPDTQIFALAYGILAAGVAQAAFQWPALRREGFRYRWVSPWRNETVREVVRKMLPASVGVAAFQLNVLITQGLAFGAGASIVAAFNYSVRLMEFPQGVFGISLATFLLPALSELAAEKKYPEFNATLRQGLEYLLFVNLLASAFLFVLAKPMVRLLFQYGVFTHQSTLDVSLALAALAPGLMAFSGVNILARAFYALGDTKTPMRISVFCLTLNLGFVLVLLRPMGASGLGLANTLSSWFNVGLLAFALRKKLGGLGFLPVGRSVLPVVASVLTAGVAAWFTAQGWEEWVGHQSVSQRIGAVFLPLIIGTGIHFGVCLWAGVPAARDVMSLLRALRRR